MDDISSTPSAAASTFTTYLDQHNDFSSHYFDFFFLRYFIRGIGGHSGGSLWWWNVQIMIPLADMSFLNYSNNSKNLETKVLDLTSSITLRNPIYSLRSLLSPILHFFH
ncbi:hypothetical protein C5167_024792 [Papaver somniferum]|uniref:Uncharacterized protein n=1 Tax=Papaver somniferum TaxID=3469 RepID=A0A4Y7JSJ5_PAPSO|nr:hypothetical protein C5167_024792 [Papaver somniferum]